MQEPAQRRERLVPGLALALGTALACTAAAPARAAELVTDGGFDDPALTAWELQIYDTSTIDWVADDATGDPGSGSLRLRKKVGENPNSLRAVQCFDIVPDSQIDLSARVRVPTQTAEGTPYLDFEWWSDPGCGGTYLNGYSSSNPAFPPDTWTDHGPHAVDVPAGVHSARLYVGAAVTVDPGSPEVFEVSWDDVSVVPEPARSAAAAALGALALVARRQRSRRSRS